MSQYLLLNFGRTPVATVNIVVHNINAKDHNLLHFHNEKLIFFLKKDIVYDYKKILFVFFCQINFKDFYFNFKVAFKAYI